MRRNIIFDKFLFRIFSYCFGKANCTVWLEVLSWFFLNLASLITMSSTFLVGKALYDPDLVLSGLVLKNLAWLHIRIRSGLNNAEIIWFKVIRLTTL